VAPALQLPVEFVKHKVAEQWRKGTPLRSPFYAGAGQPVLHYTGIQECPDEFQQPLVLDPFGNLTHQFVVIDSVEKFLQIKINDLRAAFGDILLRLRHCLMSRPTWPKTVAVFGERPVPPPLQNLQNRLLDQSIQHRRNAQFTNTSSVRLRDFHPPYRLRIVGSGQQLFPDGWTMLFQVVRELSDGHAIGACTTFIGLHSMQCFHQVFSLTYFLHQSIRAGWAFGHIHRPDRFGLFPSCSAGFTRWPRRKVQFHLDVLPHLVPEIHGPIRLSYRSGLQSSFPAQPIRCSAFRHWSASLALPADMTYYALC
jgi:hypothetical protein